LQDKIFLNLEFIVGLMLYLGKIPLNYGRGILLIYPVSRKETAFLYPLSFASPWFSLEGKPKGKGGIH